jgi:hypothetical protein
MFGLGWKVAAGMAFVALGAGAWGGYQQKKVEAVTARAVAAERAVEGLERTLEAERLAAAVLAAERDRFEARAAEYDDLREALLEGGQDAPLPDWLAAYIGRLHATDGTGGAARPE